MSTTLTRWRENLFAPFEQFPFVAPEIRVEQVFDDGHYRVRAEIPGVDPTKDIDVSVERGLLCICAERVEAEHERARSEFHYGKLQRSLPLPANAREETARAKYANGVLEVTFSLGEPKPTGRHITIEVGSQAKEAGKAKR